MCACFFDCTYILFVGLDGGHHDIWLVIDGQDDLDDTGLGEGLNLVAQNWLVAKVDERFGDGQGHGAQSSAEATNENQGFHSIYLS